MVVGRWRTISKVLTEPWYTVSLGRGDSSKPIWMALRQASRSFPNRMACKYMHAYMRLAQPHLRPSSCIQGLNAGAPRLNLKA